MGKADTKIRVPTSLVRSYIRTKRVTKNARRALATAGVTIAHTLAKLVRKWVNQRPSKNTRRVTASDITAVIPNSDLEGLMGNVRPIDSIIGTQRELPPNLVFFLASRRTRPKSSKKAK